MGMLHFIEASHASGKYVNYGCATGSPPFDSRRLSRFPLSPFFSRHSFAFPSPFLHLSFTFPSFSSSVHAPFFFRPGTVSKRQRGGEFLNGYRYRATCIVLSVQATGHAEGPSRVSFPLLISIDRRRDRVTSGQQASRFVLKNACLINETYRSPMTRVPCTACSMENMRRGVYGNRPGSALFRRKKEEKKKKKRCIIIFFNYYSNLPSPPPSCPSRRYTPVIKGITYSTIILNCFLFFSLPLPFPYL